MCVAVVKVIMLCSAMSLVELETSLMMSEKPSSDQEVSRMCWIFVFASFFSCGIS